MIEGFGTFQWAAGFKLFRPGPSRRASTQTRRKTGGHPSAQCSCSRSFVVQTTKNLPHEHTFQSERFQLIAQIAQPCMISQRRQEGLTRFTPGAYDFLRDRRERFSGGDKLVLRQRLINDEQRPALRFQIEPADIFAEQAEQNQLRRAKDQNHESSKLSLQAFDHMAKSAQLPSV